MSLSSFNTSTSNKKCKGQFTCGNKHCDAKEGLKSFEVNFQYVEAGERKNALVKLRLCPECAYKLNYKKEKEKKKAEKKRRRKAEEEESKLRKKLKEEGREDELKELDERKAREEKEEEERREREQTEKEEAERREREAEGANDIWKSGGATQAEQPKKRTDEFEDYFRGLF